MPPSIRILKYPFRTVDGKDPVIPLLAGLLSGKINVCYLAPSERRADFIKSLFPGEKLFTRSPDSLSAELLGTSGLKLFTEEHRTLFLVNLLNSDTVLSGLFGNTPGTLSILLDLINDLKLGLHHRDIERLRGIISRSISGSDRVRERSLAAADILNAYCRELAAAGAADKADLPLLAAARINLKGFPYPGVVIDGFYDLPAAQKELFAGIVNHAESAYAVIRENDGIQGLSGEENEFYSFIKTFQAAAEEKPESGAAQRFPSGIIVAKALSREDEVRWQGEEILRLTAEGVEPEKIIVTYPSMYGYYPYVKRIFGRLGIEFNTSYEQDLSAVSRVIGPVNLLQCVLENYPRRRLVETFTSPLFTAFSPQAGALLPSASRDAGIIAGEDEWKGLAERLSGETRRDGFYFGKKEELEAVCREVSLFISRSKPAELMNFEEFAVFVSGLLVLAGYKPDSGGVSNAFDGLLSAIKSYRGSGSGMKHRFKDLCKMFLDMLAKSKYGERGLTGGVKVLGILETRGVEARHIFFGGLNDGEFPLRPKQEMVLPDRLRKELGLTSFDRRIALQRFHFHRLLETPLDGIHLSYPAQDSDRLLFQSNFLPADLQSFNTAKNGGLTASPAAAVPKGAVKNLLNNRITLSETALKVFGPDMFINITAFDAYIKCPYSFYLERILKLRPFEEPDYEVDGASYGTIMHAAMQAAVKPGVKPRGVERERLETALNESLKKERLVRFWKDFVRKRAMSAAAAIEKVELKLAAEYPEVFSVEKKLSGELVPGLLKVKGRVDRIDIDGRDFLVIDYKTGKSAGSVAGLTARLESLQLPLYAALLEKEFPAFKTRELAVFDLTEGRLVRVKTEDSGRLMEAAVLKAQEIIKAVRSGDFPRLKSAKCRFCGYAGSCRGTDSY